MIRWGYPLADGLSIHPEDFPGIAAALHRREFSEKPAPPPLEQEIWPNKGFLSALFQTRFAYNLARINPIDQIYPLKMIDGSTKFIYLVKHKHDVTAKPT